MNFFTSSEKNLRFNTSQLVTISDTVEHNVLLGWKSCSIDRNKNEHIMMFKWIIGNYEFVIRSTATQTIDEDIEEKAIYGLGKQFMLDTNAVSEAMDFYLNQVFEFCTPAGIEKEPSFWQLDGISQQIGYFWEHHGKPYDEPSGTSIDLKITLNLQLLRNAPY